VSVRRNELAEHFEQQREFSKTYSPLYARLFGTVADWLAQAEDHALIDWLISAGEGRAPLEISLLLLAGLHRDILEGVAEVQPLARHYATAGGKLPLEDEQLRLDLRQAIMARRHSLKQFIQTAAVQTNETGRGLAWLLPLSFTHWDAVHLVDLGASAGLNLVADRRAYRLVDRTNGRALCDLGEGQPVQFLVQSLDQADLLAVAGDSLPAIASRTGCDLAPFRLRSAEDERTLAAYVWGDQPERLQRLREGISALHQVNRENGQIRLHQVNLPNELPRFLREKLPVDSHLPVIIYNTYMTAYLDGRGAVLRDYIQSWALTLSAPLLWIQWEPDWQGGEAPEHGWCLWTAELWQEGVHCQWRLAWVHPHGSSVKWEIGLREWREFWQTAAG
jgi:hypothetical protein